MIPSDRVFALLNGKVFVFTNHQSIIYDVETGTETILPDTILNSINMMNPIDDSAILLPLPSQSSLGNARLRRHGCRFCNQNP